MVVPSASAAAASAQPRDFIEAQRMPPSAMPSGALCSAMASGAARRSPRGAAKLGADAPTIEEAVERGYGQKSGRRETVQFAGAMAVIVIVRATGADRATEARGMARGRIARGEKRDADRPAIVRTNSGSNPNSAMPSSMPAVSGMTTRARSRASVSQMPSAAPATPTAVAMMGGAQALAAKGRYSA